ncbi:hypothetical protein AL036_04175 [Salipiger aestuarii]|uniref:Copper(I)-binding protein n=1 Tax=Salipiger aestuarii TaxID=568098 RepID=A0A327YIK0_9RHOB|nr:copper chaperone PCu(A)C [Salipiger aestuarii]EIE50482.1 hypothetical protein C357_13952 [Citreicella sp. 357]KAA8609257.1 hypothetical protein AL036_04175 [Salipiger aestuarii]KAA8615206.1 hypothetical protein AL037_03160 [Salipiger aestuarii]KAB2542868.1 hypothetical protein AL035_04450 [Salipiger aestuarii]RAK20784.1 copper(I)-binding protein [Salipiger aestuarii]
MRYPAIIALLVLPLPAIAQDHDDHLSHHGTLHAMHAWTRASARDGTTYVFVDLENHGAAPVLIHGARSDIAQTGALVGFTLENGEARWVDIPTVPVAPGRELHLEPDALAIRLGGLTQDLHRGDTFDMHLLTGIGELDLHVAVEAAGAAQHSHAGHMH